MSEDIKKTEDTVITEVDFSDDESVKKAIDAQKGLAQIKLFERAYPDVDIDGLLSDESFMSFLKELGEPLITSYEMYKASTEEKKDEKSDEEEAKYEDKPHISTGSVKSSGKASVSGYFTRDEVMSMSPEQVRKNLKKIHKSMPKWKI